MIRNVLVAVLVFAELLVVFAGEASTQDNAGEKASELPEVLRDLPTYSAMEAAKPKVRLHFATMTLGQYAGAVSMAKEGMRLFLGEMPPEIEQQFDAKWRRLFQHPCEPVVNYVNELNPRLLEFLALRQLMDQMTESLNAAQMELVAATAIGDPDAVQNAMASAGHTVIIMRTASARMDKLAKEIEELGDPPNADSLRRKAKKDYEDAMALFQPLITVKPPALFAVPMSTHTFSAKVDIAKIKAPKGFYSGDPENLQFIWKFTGGRTDRKSLNETVKYKFFLRNESPDQPVEVQLVDKVKKRILARTTVPVRVQRPVGEWVLTDRNVDVKPKRFIWFAEYKRRWSEGAAEIGKGKGNSRYLLDDGTLIRQFDYLWSVPPKRLKPDDELTLSVTAAGITGDRSSLFIESGHVISSLYLKPYVLPPEKAWIAKAFVEATARFSGSQQGESVPSTDQRKTASKKMVVPKPDIHDGNRGSYTDSKPLPPHSQLVEIKTRLQSSLLTAEIVYRYAWDSTGKRPALGEEGFDEYQPPDPATPEDEAANIVRGQIKFHRTNIEYFRKQISALERRLFAEQDPDQRELLVRDLLYQKDAMQREQDQIQYIATGQYKRTRTDIDAMNMQIMAEQSAVIAKKWGDFHRGMQRIERMFKLADPKDRHDLRRFYHLNITSDVIARGDADAMRRVTHAIGARVMSPLSKDRALAQGEADWADTKLSVVQSLKTGADYSMMGLSFVGGPMGQKAYMAYLGATGYIEGRAGGSEVAGILEAVKRTASAYNQVTILAQAGMDGYQRGVVENLEAYARNPQQVKIDEHSAGLKGAATDTAKVAAFMAAMKLGAWALSNADQTTMLKWKQQASVREAQFRAFRARQQTGQIKVKAFQKQSIAYRNAQKAKAPRETLRKLRTDMEGTYRDIKTDYFAKLEMNRVARAGDRPTLKHYSMFERHYTKKLINRFDQRMTQTGWAKQEYKTFSNSASAGKAGMDVDLGVKEPPRSVRRFAPKKKGPNQTHTEYEWVEVPTKAHKEWRKSLVKTMPDGTKVRKSPFAFQQEGDQQLRKAFKDVYGRESGEALVKFTSSYDPEAYRDLKWLGRKGMKTALVYETDPKWVQQAADVTGFKINEISHSADTATLGYYGRLQEQCRGTVKDYNTKLLPMLGQVKNPKAVESIQKINSIMDLFSNNRIGPIEANRRLQLLTGGEGMIGVQARYSALLKGARHAIAKGGK